MIILINPSVAQSCFDVSRISGKAVHCRSIETVVYIKDKMCPPTCRIWHECFACKRQHWQCSCERKHFLPHLKYSSTISPQGEVCFEWDNALYKMCEGRYNAALFNRNDCMYFYEIELTHNPFKINSIRNIKSRHDCEAC